MENTEFHIGDVVEMKKPHPCGCKNWIIKRTGVDYKLQCEKCGHLVMLTRLSFLKSVKCITKKI